MENETAGQAAEAGGSASITYGLIQKEKSDYVGMSIDEIRAEYGNVWDIPTDTQAFVGDQPVGGDYRLKANDALEFSRKMGEKG